jgi:hypothetical protein
VRCRDPSPTLRRTRLDGGATFLGRLLRSSVARPHRLAVAEQRDYSDGPIFHPFVRDDALDFFNDKTSFGEVHITFAITILDQLFTFNWAVATRISASLAFWRWCMPSPVRRVLSRFWRWALAAEVVFFLAALQIATFGYFPVLPRDTQVLHRALIQLGSAIILAFLFSIICAFAYDIEARTRPAQGHAAL